MSHFIEPERLIFDLASELKARKMDVEVVHLRRLYAERKKRKVDRPACDELTLIEWACMVGMPPFESVFVQQSQHHRCPCWGKDRDRGRTQTKSFAASGMGPPLVAHWCRSCGGHWVVAGPL